MNASDDDEFHEKVDDFDKFDEKVAKFKSTLLNPIERQTSENALFSAHFFMLSDIKK